MRRIFVLGLALAVSAAGATGASAFALHCSGNACRSVAFRDEGNGCTVVTNHSGSVVHITQGTNQLTYDLAPGEEQSAAEPPAVLRLLRGRRDGQFRAVAVADPRWTGLAPLG